MIPEPAKISTRVTSARFIAMVFFVATYCIALLLSFRLLAQGHITGEMFLAIFTGFSTICGTIVTFYFHSGGNQNPPPPAEPPKPER